MSVTVCWSAKGGSGTTVIAASLAMRSAGSLLVDLDGDLPAVLGLPEPAGQGVSDWLRSDAPAAAIDQIAVDVDASSRLVPRGATPVDRLAGRWEELADWLSALRSPVVVDAGTGPPPEELVEAGARTLLVTRACYVALRRAAAMPLRPDGVILISEPGRALGPRDVEHAVGAPVLASISIDPAVARAVDAGLALSRLPRGLTRQLRRAA